MNNKELVKAIYDAIDDKKGERITIIDISKVSIISDYFIIADGNNINQVQAICNNVDEAARKAGITEIVVEGYRTGNWILMDMGSVVVHIFNKEDRFFYDIERIWSDGEIIDIGALHD